MLEKTDNYQSLKTGFEWDIPDHYNIGVDVCDRWAARDPERTAIVDLGAGDDVAEVSFTQLSALSNRLAQALSVRGITRPKGRYPDRVGVLLAQSTQTAASHIAVLKMGCISIPLFKLFGREALLHRLRDSGAKAVITDREGAAKIREIKDELPDLKHVLSVDGADGFAECFDAACGAQTDDFEPVATHSNDPAFLIYTSGTTGNPKGVLHAHRVLLGHLPGVEMSHNFLPEQGDRFWTPADWAWIGGLLDVLMPALHHGIAVVARRFEKFTPDAAFELMKTHAVRNAFLPPTALKMMRQHPDPERFGLALRSVGSGGETLGAELLEWSRQNLGTPVNEFYGQTECNMIVSSSAPLGAPTPGVMGWAVPGHRVEIIDPHTGAVLPTGTEGSIAVLSPDPVMFLEYWNNPDATREKFITGPAGKWMLTGDTGIKTSDEKFKFVGRDDDVIGASGYRIGPSEIEDCLLGHPAVAVAGAVAKPDNIRGAIVAAYVVLKEGTDPSDALAREIQTLVKTRLAAHEYPRVLRFISKMPMTTTGKIIRGELRKMAYDEYVQDQAKADGISAASPAK